ncbi:Talin-1 [Chytriomyces hyalinus]|nr:Talin-1 [Chytriomyces hyalinus]
MNPQTLHALKINAVDQSSTKTLQFSGATFVHDACKEIRTTFGETAGGSDHGLFWPETGKWLHPSKVLDYYDLKTGDLLQFRKKHCPLKVKTLDESVKTVLVDESLPVGKLVLAVCERLGIHNADEYSFALESGAMEAMKRGSPDTIKKPSSTGSTRKMSLTSMLPHLKKEKKPSSEETRWLKPDITLREQGVKETDAVLLKKKFFYTDQNIDRNDPIQLNLLFNQAKEMIISGKHPCTLEEAAQFAAIQAQCQFGNHEPDRYKGAHLQLMDLVPSEYRNNRDLTKRIISEHAKLQGLSDLNAKFRYVQLSRSLKTYGITFFLVKEKLDKKSKLVDVLLGVTKQSIVRLDAVTKDVIKTWPLTHLRRWAAAANSFTLDFGDYADNYFTVQTSEGDQISQLIAGYIDIILKKKKEAEKVFHEEDEVLTTSEEYVKPVKAVNAAILSNGHKQATEIRVGTLMTASNSRAFPKSIATSTPNEPAFNPEYNEPLQSLLETISMGLAVLNNSARDLDNDIHLPPFANDAVSQEWKQTTIETNVDSVSSHLTSHLAYCASVMNLFKSDFEGVDFDQVIHSVNGITCNLSQMSNGIKLLAALTNSDEEKESFKRAAKDVFEAAVGYVKATQAALAHGVSKETVLSSSGNVTVTSSDLLALIGRSDVPEDTQTELQELAKSVSRAVADVINAARKSAEDISDPHDQLQVASNAKLVSDACNQLVACSVMVAPVVSSQVCLDQLEGAAEFVQSAAVQVCESCSTATTNESVLESLHASIERVQESIHRLLEKARNCDQVCYEVGPMEKEFDDVIQSIDGIADKCVSADDVLHAAKELTLSNTHYINAMKRVALDTGEEDQDKDKLMSAARTLADLTSQMVLAAKEASKNSEDPRTMSHFHDMVDCIRQVVNDSSGHSIQKKTMVKLGKSVKNLLASQNLLVSAAVAAGPSNRNQVAQIEFNQQVKNVSGLVAALNQSWKCHVLDLDDLKIIPALTALIQSSRAICPTIGDSALQSHIETLIQQTTFDLESFQKSTATAEEICSSLKLESALCSIKSLQQSLVSNDDIKLPSIKTTNDPFKVQQGIKTISTSIDTLCEAVMMHDDKTAGISAAEAVIALQAIHLSAAGILTTDTDQEEYKTHLSAAASGVARTLAALIESAQSKKSRQSADDFDGSTNRLVTAAKEALIEMELCMPGRKELGQAVTVVDEYSAALNAQKLEISTATGLSYPAAQIQLQHAISCLAESAGSLASAAKGSVHELQTSAKEFTADFQQFIEASCALSHSGADASEAGQILSNLGSVCHLSKEFLTSITQVSLDSTSSSLRNELLAKARALSETLTSASELCFAPAPGFKECKHALDVLLQAKTLLAQVNETTGGNDDSYGQSLQTITQLSKKMNGRVTAFLASKSESANVNYGEMLIELAQTMHAVTGSTVRAVYLIGISDPSTTPAIPPSINILEFETIAEDIREAFQKLVDPNNTHESILELAGTIAKQTSKLCGLCKTYGSTGVGISQPSKMKFVQFAKEIALDTAASVPSIKCLALEPTVEALTRVQESSNHLLRTVNRTVDFARSDEFVGAPAKVSPQSARLQKPILDITKNLITAVHDLINTVKQSLSNPTCTDIPAASTKQAKCITETILKFVELVTLHAPGQKECSEAISKLSESIHVLDAAIFDATVDNLEVRSGVSRDGLVHTVRGLASLVEVITRSCVDVAQLKNAVAELPAGLAKMSSLSVSVASALPEKESRLGLLSQAKAISESVQTLMNAIKNSTVSHTDKSSHIEETHASTHVLIQAFISTLEGGHDQSGEFLNATKRIESASSRFENLEDSPASSYPQLVAELEQSCKGLVEKVGDVLTKAKSAELLRECAETISCTYESICKYANSAAQVSSEVKTKESLATTVRELGTVSARLIETMSLQSMKCAAGVDNAARLKLGQVGREVGNAVAVLLEAARHGNRAFRQAQESLVCTSNIILDLESAEIFAQSGNLDPLDAKDHFSKHKESLLMSAKSLTDAVQNLSNAAHSNQDDLIRCFNRCTQAATVLKEKARESAISITSADNHMQQKLLAAAKTVAESLQTLIQSSSVLVSQRQSETTHREAVDHSARTMFASIASLVQITKLLSDEAMRGERALDGAIDEMDAVLTTLNDKNAPVQGTALPAEVMNIAKQLVTTTAKLVSAIQLAKQDELVSKAGILRKQVHDLARTGKAAAEGAPAETKLQAIHSIHAAITATKQLLISIKSPPSSEASTKEHNETIQTATKNLAQSLNMVISSSQQLIPTGYVDSTDPNVIAERELLSAALAIESASKKLASLKPQESARGMDQDLNFDQQILEAAKAIAAATCALVKSATHAQREIVASRGTAKRNILGGKGKAYFSDGTWSNGLVSAAKQVAQSTAELCEAANNAVKDKSKEASKNSEDPRTMSHFHDMVDCIRQVVNDSSGHSIQKKTMVKLGKSGKNLLASQNLLVSAAVAAGPSNRNQVVQIEFNQQVKNVSGLVAALNQSWKCHVLDLDDLKIIPALTALIQSSRAICPTIGDSALQSHIETLIQQTTFDLESVQKSTATAEEICSSLKLESALCSIKSLQQILSSNEDIKLPSIKATSDPFKVQQSIKTISTSIDTLCEAVMLHDDKTAGISAAEAVFALQSSHLSAAGILATGTDQEEYKTHLSAAASGVAGTLAALIESAQSKKSRQSADDFDGSTNRLVTAVKEALIEMELCMPGRKELGQAVTVVDEYSAALSAQKLEIRTVTGLSYPAAQIQLQHAISCLAESAGSLASAAKSSVHELQTSAKEFTADFQQYIEASCALSHSGADAGEAGQILSNLGSVCHLSKEFLTSITQVSLDSTSSSLRNELLAKARALSETLTSASELCFAPAPGFKECKHALDVLLQAKTLLAQVNETTGGNDDSYGQSLQTMTQLSKKMNGRVTAFLASKSESANVNYGEMMIELAQTMHAVTGSTVRAVYLIGISDPSTTPAIPPSINILEFETIAEDIREAFQKLVDPNNTHESILELAGTIAKQTSKLCGLCKTYGSTGVGISQPSKMKFVQFAKEIALDTAASVPSIKCLALEPTAEALTRVQESSNHLLGTVNRTVDFARSDEFVGAPAKVSPQCALLQKPILDITKHLITTVHDLINTVKQSLSNPTCTDIPAASTKQAKCITETILKFVELVTLHAPGQKECSEAISKLSESIHVLDAAIFDATVDNLEVRSGVSRDGLVHTVRGLASLVEVITRSCVDVAQLKNAVAELPAGLAKMSSLSVSVTSALPEKESRLGLLSQAKAISESVQTLMNAIRNSTVSHTGKSSHIEETHASTHVLIQAFISTLEGGHDQSGEFLNATKRIDSASSRFENLEDSPASSYPQLVAELEQSCKGLVEKVGDVLTKAKSAELLRECAETISCTYESICKYANSAAQVSSEVKTKESLATTVRELGTVSARLIETMSLQSMKCAAGVDHAARLKLGQVGREVGNVVAVLLEAARHGNRAFRQAQQSLVCTSNIILDLESAEIFAQRGNLDPLDAKDHFSKHKESLLMSAKSLTDAVQNLSNAAHSNQDDLIRCFNRCTQAATVLKEKARESAISITSADNHMQKKLLAAARTVAESLQTLIQSSSVLVSQRQSETTHREAVDHSARTMFASIASLVQITKLLSDEAMRGERALDGAIDEMDAVLTTLNDTNAPVQGTALPAEVMNIAKQLVTTTANLVSAIQLTKQDELVSKAGILRKQVHDLARTGKAAAEGAPAETKLQTIHSIHAAITATKQLLISIKTPPSSDASTKEHNETIQTATKNLAQSLYMVISSSQQLIPTGYVDSTDPNVIAERELLSAALAIEAASKKLASLKPQESARGVDQDLNFDQQILEAAKAIAAATCALVKSATHAQREIVASRGTAKRNILGGKGKAYFSDGTWSNGLVSAAKQVAQSTAELCEAANNAVKDKCEMEMVSVKAKAVATSTAQLISAAAANSEVHSQSQIGLKAAGKAVTHATDQLVKAAQDAGVSFSESDILSGTNLKDVGSTSARVMEMDAQVSILKMEKELEKARAKLAAVRKGKYDVKKQGGGK